jgi:hypothetical protein
VLVTQKIATSLGFIGGLWKSSWKLCLLPSSGQGGEALTFVRKGTAFLKGRQ